MKLSCEQICAAHASFAVHVQEPEDVSSSHSIPVQVEASVQGNTNVSLPITAMVGLDCNAPP